MVELSLKELAELQSLNPANTAVYTGKPANFSSAYEAAPIAAGSPPPPPQAPPQPVNPANPYAQLTPQQVHDYNAGINGVKVAPQQQGSYIAYNEAGEPYAVGKQPEPVAEPQKTDSTGHQQGGGVAPTIGNPVASKVPGATPVTASGDGGRGMPSVSPERQHLAESEANRNKVTGTIEADKGTLESQISALQKGFDLAKGQNTIAESISQLNDAQRKMDIFQAESSQKERDRQLAQEAEEVRAAKVDPKHWFKERGVAGSILAAISMAAGAFAAAMPHTNSKENFAANIINKSIDQDVAAQEHDIANKWKTLNYKGDENNKAYIKGQYILNQKNELYQKEYSHAKALATDALSSARDQSSILGLKSLIGDLDRKQLAVSQQGTDHRLSVLQTERTRAAAAAHQTSLSPRERLAEIKDLVGKGYSEKDAASAIDFRISGGKRGESTTPPVKLTGESKDGKQEAAANDKLTSLGNAVTGGYSASVAGALGPVGQRVAPDLAKLNQDRENYNTQKKIALRAAGDRLPGVDVEKLNKDTDIHSGDTPAIRKQKVEQFRTTISMTVGLRGKGNQPPPQE